MTTFNGKMLGQGIPGATNNSKLCGAGNAIQNLQVLERSRLRRAFGNSRIALTYPVGPHGASALWASSTGYAKTTPFRVAFNGGDPNGTTNTYTSTKYGKESNQVTRGSLGRLSSLKLGDSVRQSNSNEGAAWSGNVKFVYDSSDYTRYKNLRAHNRNYNDINRAGGEQPNSTVFSVLNRVR